MEYIKEFFKTALAVLAMVAVFLFFLAIVCFPLILSDMGHFWWGGAVILLYFVLLIGTYSYLSVKERRQ